LGKSSTTFVPKVVLDKHLRRAAAESKTPLRAKGAGFIINLVTAIKKNIISGLMRTNWQKKTSLI